MKAAPILIALGLVSLTLVGLLQPSNEKFEAQFVSYMTQFNKNYQTEDEYTLRRNIFNKNLETINEHNDQGLSWTMSVNAFTDWTDDEYKTMLGYRGHNNLKASTSDMMTISADDAEWESIDHIANGYVGPVKNQGKCGSCWAFSTVASLEGAYAKEFGELKRFSEQHVAFCDRFSFGCQGGWSMNGLMFFTENAPIAESDLPYNIEDQTCSQDSVETNEPTLKYLYRPDDTPESLYEALTHNVVSVAIRAENDAFRHYGGGVISGDACGTAMDHAVTLVGYEKSTNSWKVKNSWGADWGEDGYVRIEVADGKGVCGINQDTTQATWNTKEY